MNNKSYKSALIIGMGLIGSSIARAIRKNKVKVSAIQDYTAEQVEIELKLARGVYSEDVVETLYAFTECEVSISAQFMLIQDNKPKVLSVTEVLQQNVDQLINILTAELRLEKNKLKERLHARTLEQLFIENRIYKVIPEPTILFGNKRLSGKRKNMSLRNLSLKLLFTILFFLPLISLSQDNIKVKMNLPLDKSGKFLYVDIDNPIQISVSNYQSNDEIIHYNANDLTLSGNLD